MRLVSTNIPPNQPVGSSPCCTSISKWTLRDVLQGQGEARSQNLSTARGKTLAQRGQRSVLDGGVFYVSSGAGSTARTGQG